MSNLCPVYLLFFLIYTRWRRRMRNVCEHRYSHKVTCIFFCLCLCLLFIYNTIISIIQFYRKMSNDTLDALRQLYHKYDEIIRFSAYAFTGWFLSWVLFFIMLPLMARAYGKIRGASLNYAFSWFSMIAIILGLEFSLGWIFGNPTFQPKIFRSNEHFSFKFQTFKLIRIKI